MDRLSFMAIIAVVLVAVLLGTYVFWRYVWFFRNPDRSIPQQECIVSPADGTVVYVKEVQPGDDVIVIKEGIAATVTDIVKEDPDSPRILIGIFMSPFDVHYNRAPISGTVDMIRHHPARTKNRHMTSMHWRTILGRKPLYLNSLHVIENERTVTRIAGRFREEPISCYVVQIAGGSVDGIDSFKAVGERVEKGSIFGMIRIGSQVDLVVPHRAGMEVRVEAGDQVRAGESILIHGQTG